MMSNNLVLVPRRPTVRMVEAACDAMRKRQVQMGEDWYPVSNKDKARIRWAAMIVEWERTIYSD